MQLSLDEQALWAPIKDYFCPNGMIDSEAFQAYLTKYAHLEVLKKASDPVAQHVLGIVFKHAPDDVFSQFFATYYLQFRTGEQSEAFDAWLGENTTMRPETVANALKQLAIGANFTHQVMVLKDIKKWYPERNIKEYVPLKLFKTKPSVVLKQLNPALADMPYLLDMCQELLQSEDAQAKTLGDTIARGCFIARYGMPEDLHGLRNIPGVPNPSCKYGAIAAFSMLVQKGIVLDPRTLLKQVQLRFNGKSVVTDALAYCTIVLETHSKDNALHANARDVLDAVLDCLHEKTQASPSNLEWGRMFCGLARSHMRLEPTPLAEKLKNTMRTLLGVGAQEVGCATLLAMVLACHPSLALELTRAFLDERVDPSGQAAALEHLVLQYDIDEDKPGRKSVVALQTGYVNEAAKGLFFAMLAPTDVPNVVLQELRRIMREEENPTGRSNAIINFVSSLAKFPWMAEQREAFKQSEAAAPLILLYLYYGAAGHNNRGAPVRCGLLPFTDWQPLPFLKKVYPEKMELWNTMTKGLLRVPASNPYFVNGEPYEQVMAFMYEAFAQAFLSNAVSLNATHGILDLGLDPLDYFLNMDKKFNPTMELELPSGMFAFD